MLDLTTIENCLMGIFDQTKIYMASKIERVLSSTKTLREDEMEISKDNEPDATNSTRIIAFLDARLLVCIGTSYILASATYNANVVFLKTCKFTHDCIFISLNKCNDRQ